MRSAIVIPIPKVNPPRIISEDLRPISLTATLSKQLEKIVGGWMLDYIVDRLNVHQYGGLRGLSTTHALVDMVHTWLLTTEEKKASHVDHTVLVTKCKSYNLPNLSFDGYAPFYPIDPKG